MKKDASTLSVGMDNQTASFIFRRLVQDLKAVLEELQSAEASIKRLHEERRKLEKQRRLDIEEAAELSRRVSNWRTRYENLRAGRNENDSRGH